MLMCMHPTVRRKFYYNYIVTIFLYLLQQASSDNQECGHLSVDKPPLKGGLLTLEENSLLNITFSFKNISCTMVNEFNFQILFNTGVGHVSWLPQCNIMLTENLCRGSPVPNMVCTCITNFMFMFQKTVNKTEAKYWKISAPSTNLRDVYFNLTVTEQTSLTLHESFSSTVVNGLFRESDGTTEGKTFSITAFNDITTAIQTTSIGEKIENPLMGIIIYVLGAVIIIIVVMAIVICVIVRTLHMKDTLHSDVMQFETRLEMSELGPSIKEDEFAKSSISSAHLQPKSTISTEKEYTEIYSYVNMRP